MNKSILITGCASGIGHYSAHALKKQGYRVFAAARKTTDVETLQSQGLESLLLDVNDSNSIQQGIAHILQLTNGTLDAVFNNAGFLQAGAIEDLTRDMDRAQFETNVFGVMELTRQALLVMRKQGYGRIIQNSSILGIITMPYYGAYNASKFALEGYSNTLRQELRGTNIHVSILNPGPIYSKLRDNAYQHWQTTLSQAHSHFHKAAYERIEKNYFHPTEADRRFTVTPDVLVKKLLHALEHPHPKAHYYIGRPAQLLAFLRRILPDSVLDWALVKTQNSG